ncbi:MAG: phosphoribosylanthranilate isomerase [Actinomycetota bacterium]|nr:phosphoribosylanthranilate isomerase [Actinomycetota bacterium]
MFVKICGTTSEDDALLAVAMGADAIGFIFAPSPRQVHPAKVSDIVKRLPPEILTVGVFRDEHPERVVSIINQAGLKAAQLHGHESAEQSRWVRERVPITIKAFPAGSAAVGKAKDYGADLVMLDAADPGSGQIFDWRLVDGVPPGTRLVLAGGLTAENVVDAIGQSHPWGVDVVTGVESEPGRKDPRKLRAFVAAAKSAAVPRYENEAIGPYDWQAEF